MDLMDNQILIHILVWLATAEFAIQIVVSDLSAKIKGLTGLNQPFKLRGLCRYRFWRKLFGKLHLVLSPLSLILILFFSIYSFFSEMVDCPYCIGFWLGLAVNHFFLHYALLPALIFAPMVLVFVALLDRLHS